MSLKKFESPYLEWHLSEILAPVILNDIRIKKLLKQKASFYYEHIIIKIDRQSAPKYFMDLYDKIAKNNDFKLFLQESYRVIKKNKNLFKI